MNLASISENRDIEKRIAITPEIAKKYISLGFNLTLPNNYGTYLGFTDEEYKNLGVNFSDNEEEIIKNSEIVIQLGLPVEEKLSLFKESYDDEVLDLIASSASSKGDARNVLHLIEGAAKNAEKDGRKNIIPEDIQTIIYTSGKENGYSDNLRNWFKLIYEVIFGEENGPRMGFFISFFGLKETIDLMEKKLKI